MVSRSNVEDQLKRVGCNYRFWGRGEINQLANLLMDDETIAQCVNGRYNGGFAMLCATDRRVLLIDNKPLKFLNIEDLRYDMITQFNYSYRMVDATIHIYTNNAQALDFNSWNKARLHKLLRYAQQRVMEVRWHEEQLMQQQFTSQQQSSPSAQPSQALQTKPVPSAFANLGPGLGHYTYSKLPHFVRQNMRQRSQGTVNMPNTQEY